jgi:hypothetical protein
MKRCDIEKKLITVLKDTLKGVPFLKTSKGKIGSVTQNGSRPDAVLQAELNENQSKKLVLEIKSIGQPRQIREAVNQLLRFTSEQPDFYGIIGAPYISPAAAKICEKEGIGYLDLAGNCRLVFDTVYIVREGASNPFIKKRDLRSLYSPRASRVLRVILNNPRTDWKMQALANAAQVSIGQVANVKKLLKDREWIIESNKGFKLKNPSDLLDEWSKNYTFRKNEVRDFYCMSNAAEIEQKLAQVCTARKLDCALTGLSGAARVQPGIRYQRTMAFVSDLSDDLISSIGLKAVSSGINVTILLPYDEGVFNGLKKYDDIQVVSPIQLYLDLRKFKGRGEEAAQIIYNKVLKKSW